MFSCTSILSNKTGRKKTQINTLSNQRSNFQHSLDDGESKGVPEKHLLFLHWLKTLCGRQWTRKVLKENGTPDHLMSPEKSVCWLTSNRLEAEIEHPSSKMGKEYDKPVYSHPPYLSSLQSTSCKIARLDNSQAGIKIAGRYINNLRCRWYHSHIRKWKGTKEPVKEGEREEWKS